jgi:transcription antitermination factor NusG
MTKKKTPYKYQIGERVFIRSGAYYGRYGVILRDRDIELSVYTVEFKTGMIAYVPYIDLKPAPPVEFDVGETVVVPNGEFGLTNAVVIDAHKSTYKRTVQIAKAKVLEVNVSCIGRPIETPDTPETPDLILEDFMNLYRTPTADEHLNLPIQCVVRDSTKHEWKPALLVEITRHQVKNFVTLPFNILPENVLNTETTPYKYCRIRNNKAPITKPASAESIVDPPPAPKAIGEVSKLVALKQKLHKEKEKLNILDMVPVPEAPPHSSQPIIASVGTRVKFISGKFEGLEGVVVQAQEADSGRRVKLTKQLDVWTLTDEIQEVPASDKPLQRESSVESSESTKILQSHVAARFDCIDPVVLKLLAECLGFGAAKYYPGSYHRIPVDDHINHALNHINEHRRLSQETRIDPADEMHLVNALARITFAISCLAQQGKYPTTYSHPEQNK